MTSPVHSFVTRAGCSETTMATSTALMPTTITNEDKEHYYGISQQDKCDEKVRTEHDMSYAANITSSTNTEMRKHKEQFDVASTSVETHQVVKVLSPLATDRKMPVVVKEECDTEASTSLSLVTVAKCRRNQHNKVRYKCVRRRKPRQNCQLPKKLPKKRRKESPTYRQYSSMIQQVYNKVKEIHTRCKSSERECRKVLERMQGLLYQSWIEQFWQQRILQQIGIQISQSEHNATVLLSHAQRPNSTGIKTTCTQKDYSRASELGSVKSTKLSTESARFQSSSLASAPGLAKSYKKPQCQMPSFIQLQDVREDTSKKVSIKIKSTSPRSSNSRSFQNLTNSSFQNYMHRLPAVRMARTKQTARKSRDDRQEEDRRREHDRRDSPPRRGRGRSPVPQSYVCVFCRKVNKQRTNHRRHLVMQHSCRLDGTPATEADLAQARRWSAKEATGRSSRYKTQEFVESASDDDTTQASGASTPSRRGSPPPPGGRRSKRTRSESSESSSPQRAASPRRGGSQRPSTVTSTISRPSTPPHSAPPAPKQARKARFEQEEVAEQSSKSGAMTMARGGTSGMTKGTTTTTKRGQRTSTDTRSTAKKEDTEVVTTSPKLDALAAVAKRAVQNLKQREIGVKIKEPPATSRKDAEPPVKRHQHPLPSKGRSAYVRKGKEAAPTKKPPEIVTVSLHDVLGTLFPAPESKVTPSSHPTPTTVSKPISTTAEATPTETIQIEDEPSKKDKAPELPQTTTVGQDLELSPD